MNLAPLIDDTIQMVDLTGQYQRIKPEIDAAIQDCIDQAIFIKGGKVTQFENQLAQYLDVGQVISCGNGTDAIQLAFMALGLKPGDEVIVPAFTYAAAAEVIALLGLVPVLVDVDPLTFNMTAASVEGAFTAKTRAVVPVHLFGQCADMESIINLCSSRELYIIEDNAQSLGAQYTFKAGKVVSAGSLGHLGITSFFPSKNLGCFGDGGAVYTNHPELGARVRMIANHGQEVKYRHDVIGINSRLDTIQAVILLEKLKFLNSYINARQQAASWYDAAFQDVAEIEIPGRTSYSTHVFHQYTLKVPAQQRDALKSFLQQRNIPSMVYYPISLAGQKAYRGVSRVVGDLAVTEELCQQVLSLPMHTELRPLQLEYITDSVRAFFEMAR